MSKLSVVIITKNEERNIADCLATVEWADEIIIVDSFSTDRTVEIAKKYTDKIFQRQFTNYSDQKNFGAAQASNPWILSIDADERVSSELKEEICQVITKGSSDGYLIPCLDYMFGKKIKYGGWYPQYHLRLYKKDKGKWVRAVHEFVTVDGKIEYLKNPLLHFSHLTISNFIQKLDRYTSMEAENLFLQQKKTNIFNIIFLPLIVFIYKYLFCLGFLDGVHGLFLAVSLAYYHFAKHTKLWELWFKNHANK
jgi:glycosyltransferase involved in cell wall biosynthesis|uniref:Glycosyltransferase family 2 protein n=1 Tax=candidate division WOR-3 bacterium TaxID=2052148 RepID=A0A7V3RFR5_UNCW3